MRFDQLSKSEKERAQKLHRESIFVNGLDPTMITEFKLPYMGKLRQGGVTTMNITVDHPLTIGYQFTPSIGFHNFIECYYDWTRNMDELEQAGEAVRVTSAKEIRDAKKKGKIAVIFGLQNGVPIEDDLRLLTILHKLGIRIIQITYNYGNLIGDGCFEKRNGGLTNFGVKAVEEMNRLGILVDLSHVGWATTLDALEVSKDPVVFSHASTNALCPSTRNKTDEMIKILAEKGGVIGMNSLSGYLNPNYLKEGSTIEHYLDHIDHVVNLVGSDYVGIGLDGGEGRVQDHLEMFKKRWPEMPPVTIDVWQVRELNDATKLANISEGLVARGYSDQEIKKILGENFLRVFKSVWGN